MTNTKMTLVEISTWALEAAVKAMDERIATLKAHMASMGARQEAQPLESELANLIKASVSLRETHEEAIWQQIPLASVSSHFA